jgi:excisionase family DNA binding protein
MTFMMVCLYVEGTIVHESIQSLLNTKEAAQLLILSENTIRMWIWQKRLPVVRLGRAVRLKRSDIQALIERSTDQAMVPLSGD